MVDLIIDEQKTEVNEGKTVLQAAESLGLEIPTMCHLADHPNFTSCMVCMVEDESTGQLIPACSTLATSGMRISTKSEKAVASRKDALELLLSEHVGDCDAPCQVVCRAGIDIPAMLRAIAGGDIDRAALIIESTSDTAGNPCEECRGRCEKACRRGLHDAAVSIQLLIRYALEYGQPQDQVEKGDAEPSFNFNCNMGKIQDGEIDVFLEQASRSVRIEPADGESEGYSAAEAQEEARRCLHCDCRKRTDCKLRVYSSEYGARQRRYAIARRKPFRQNRQHGGIVYEPGKCIKCGICVRITERERESLGLAFIGRGFDVEVGVPFNESLEAGLEKTACLCAEKCPTGAIALQDDIPEGET